MSTKKKATSSLKNAGALPEYQLIDIQKIKPYANNAKKHPPKQVEQIAGSMQQFGVISPLITDYSYEIMAGHGRYEAAKFLGFKQVPVILIDHLSEAEKRAYRLADNQLTLNTGYDNDLLKIEITELIEMNLNFDIEITGFETATLDIILDGDKPIENDPADDVPSSLDGEPIVTKAGDVWIMDKHRLICADSLQEQSYKELLLTETAHMIFTDPPYNVSVNGHVCGKGKIKHDEFAMASGEMSEEEFIKFLITFITLTIQHSRDGSLHYICMDWRHIFELLSAGRTGYSELKNICVWNKDNGGMGSLYRSKHELVAVFKHGTKPHLNTIELGKHGRYRTNVWDYRGVNGFAGQSDLAMHPTVKPVAMVVDAVKDCTRRNHIVLDPFAGSGSTLIACEKSGRQARCIELEPKYCDVIARRWQGLTGLEAVHAETGKTFNEIQNAGEKS
jgi:DNA modification methylase